MNNPLEQAGSSERLGEKQLLWKKTLEQLEGITDGLGLPIDPGIKETVVAFTLNGFKIASSCEGHVEERFGEHVKLRPYVWVGLDEPEQRFVGESEIKSHIAAEYGVTREEVREKDEAWHAYWDYVTEHDTPETPEYLAVREQNEMMEKKVLRLLRDFYVGLQTSEKTRLGIERIGPAGHFIVTTPKENPEEVEEQDLAHYRAELSLEQAEMKSFSDFLKEKFFENTSAGESN